MLSFEHIEYLLGAIAALPLVILFMLVLRWKQKVKKALGDEELIDRVTAGYSSRLYKLKFIVVLIALVLAVVAAANLRKPLSGEKEKTVGIDLMIAIDVSKSMLGNDIKPSRFERAKQLVSVLIDQLENNRVGLVIFAGHAYLQMPLTPDLTEAKLLLSNISTEIVPVQGTNISEALKLCDNSLNTKEKSHKAAVLITDGEDHDANTNRVAQQLTDNGVIVYTVGIGTVAGSPIMDPETGNYKTDKNGITIISKLNEEELKNIAIRTGGEYFHLENAFATANDVTTELNGIEKKLIESGGEKEYFSYSPIFIAIIILLLVFEVFIPETLKRNSNSKLLPGYNWLNKNYKERA